MTLREILQSKGGQVYKIEPDASLDEAVRLLVKYNIGSLVVCDSMADAERPPMIGIVTERDILRIYAAHRGSLEEIAVSEVMSFPVTTCAPDETVSHAMNMLTLRRMRHLPIEKDGDLCGMISIGDLVKAHGEELSKENHFLKSYIQS